jgi:hypothetical protein
VYLNDFLFPVYLLPPSRGRLGLIPATARERLSNRVHLPPPLARSSRRISAACSNTPTSLLQASLVSNVRRWEMSLPGNASWEPGASAAVPAAARPWVQLE